MTFAIDIGRCPAVPHSLGTGTVGQSAATNDYNDLALSRCPTPRDAGTVGRFDTRSSCSRVSPLSHASQLSLGRGRSIPKPKGALDRIRSVARIIAKLKGFLSREGS